MSIPRTETRATVEGEPAQAVPAGQPQPVLYWVEADENRMLDGLYIEPDQENEYRSNGRTLIPLYASPPAGTAAAPRLTDERLDEMIEASLRGRPQRLWDALTFTRWHDGIDCQYPTPDARTFARALLAQGNQEGA